KEAAMSRRRIVVSCAVMALVVAAGGGYAINAFPMKSAGAAQVEGDRPGPIERRAQPITPENPVPRRIYAVTPVYPPELAAAQARASMVLRVTLDASGRVAEVRCLAITVRGGLAARGTPGGANAAVTAMDDMLVQSAIDAIDQW